MCTGSIGIVIEHIFSMGRCMQTRRNNFLFQCCFVLSKSDVFASIGIVMEYIYLMGKCMQSRMYYFLFKIHIIVIINVCLCFAYLSLFSLMTGATGIAMEYMCFMYVCFERNVNFRIWIVNVSCSIYVRWSRKWLQMLRWLSF